MCLYPCFPQQEYCKKKIGEGKYSNDEKEKNSIPANLGGFFIFMKGFGIYIKNDLLESKHIEAMGESLWLYLWLLDHMTSIQENGVGKVLGGTPVKYEYIKKELGISADTYTRWVKKLSEYPYIQAIRTPIGISFRVLKAKKRFRKNAGGFRTTAESKGFREHAESNTIQNNTDNTIDTAPASPDAIPSKLINETIDLFKVVNPNHERLFGQPPQRKATERLLKKFGQEKLWAMIKYLPKSNGMKYAPTITTPVQFETKLGELVAFFRKQKGEGGIASDVAIIL